MVNQNVELIHARKPLLGRLAGELGCYAVAVGCYKFGLDTGSEGDRNVAAYLAWMSASGLASGSGIYLRATAAEAHSALTSEAPPATDTVETSRNAVIAG